MGVYFLTMHSVFIGLEVSPGRAELLPQGISYVLWILSCPLPSMSCVAYGTLQFIQMQNWYRMITDTELIKTDTNQNWYRIITLRCTISVTLLSCVSFPNGSDGKESTCNTGELGSVPEQGTSPGGGHGNPLQYSCLENPMDRGAWWALVHGVAKSQTRLSN